MSTSCFRFTAAISGTSAQSADSEFARRPHGSDHAHLHHRRDRLLLLHSCQGLFFIPSVDPSLSNIHFNCIIIPGDVMQTRQVAQTDELQHGSGTKEICF